MRLGKPIIPSNGGMWETEASGGLRPKQHLFARRYYVHAVCRFASIFS